MKILIFNKKNITEWNYYFNNALYNMSRISSNESPYENDFPDYNNTNLEK